jgi:hypothetical protein
VLILDARQTPGLPGFAGDVLVPVEGDATAAISGWGIG